MIGFLDWQITEVATGRELASDKRNIGFSDIKVDMVETTEFGLQQLSLELSLPFVISLPRSLVPEADGKLSGFGFSARREDIPSFSWEWFIVSNPQLAEKLQETGKLGIETVNGEVVRTDFLSNASLRIVEMSMPVNLEAKWRIQVLEGSWMRWPGSWELK